MERIAADKKWSREDIDNDIAILSKNRIVYVMFFFLCFKI